MFIYYINVWKVMGTSNQIPNFRAHKADANKRYSFLALILASLTTWPSHCADSEFGGEANAEDWPIRLLVLR